MPGGCSSDRPSGRSSAAKVDPFTIEIIREQLIAAAEESFITLGRSSQSPIIYEVLDYACALTDRTGDLIAQANGVPGFLGTLTFAVKAIIEKHRLETMRPGDIFMTNDPFIGGGNHLSDVALIAPIFYEDEIVAFSVNKAHWTEVGGHGGRELDDGQHRDLPGRAAVPRHPPVRSRPPDRRPDRPDRGQRADPGAHPGRPVRRQSQACAAASGG